MSRATFFVDIILPLSVPLTYTYRVPFELNDAVLPGQRAIVQFGRNKLYTGIICRIHENPPQAYTAKYLEALLDESPVVTAQQLRFWEWLSSYYCCHPGEVMIAALPASLKLASESRILLTENASERREHLSAKEDVIFDALQLRHVLSLAEVAELLEQKTVYPIIKSMLEKGVVVVEEEVREKYIPRQEEFVALTEEMADEELLREGLNSLSKAPKQLDMVMRYLQQLQENSANDKWIRKTELQQFSQGTAAITQQLVKKGIFQVRSFETDRIKKVSAGDQAEFMLSAAQEKACQEIIAAFAEKKPALLHGVTSSGKTEIYSKLIRQTIDQGRQVLYLLPEIALTTQLISRLQKKFGDRVGVYHSRFNPQERAEIWHKMLKNERYQVFIGARSSVFLPFSNLGLVIVDEEHETSFKQHDPAPRYHARDAALVLAGYHHANILLGSATPSIESYWNAKNDKYRLVELHTRFGDMAMPEIITADLRKERHNPSSQGPFTGMLLEEINASLEKKEQVILFQNRRGYSPRWQCETCGWTPMCHQCDISLTYHKAKHRLTCHYCGHAETPPKKCTACGSHALKMIGFGTEKLEEELAGIFPGHVVERMDYDTTRSKNAYARIISDFEEGRIDILVGTQMVSKGLDFDNVGLVGILNAGQMLYFPDFRAYERAFQLMAQVAGRAGRKHKQGKVIIQAEQPDHRVIRQVTDNDYLALYNNEIQERMEYKYPPFYRLIQLSVRHFDKGQTDQAAARFSFMLRSVFGEMVLGPEYGTIERIRNQYHKNILIKFERSLNHGTIKKRMVQIVDDFYGMAEFKGVRVVIDVDPV